MLLRAPSRMSTYCLVI